MHRFLVILVLLTGFLSGYAQAGLVSTQEFIQSADGSYYSTEQLQEALASEELQQQLAQLGVDTDQLADRVASLTPEEIRQLNSELEGQPAGGGILGALLVIFILFVITDMLCATNLFSFVNCINK